MEESIWRNFPEDLLANVMVFLPVQSLLRFCSVSKLWNSIPKHPKFHETRDTCWREFVEEVLNCRRWRPGGSVRSCTNGFMLIENGLHDIFVIRPTKLYLRQIPRPEWTLGAYASKFEIRVVGMVVDERTRDFSVILSSRLNPSLRIPKDLDGPGRVPWDLDYTINLHQFKSTTGVWSWCGSGNMNLICSISMIGVGLHRDCLLVVVRRNSCYQVYYYCGDCSWKTLTLPGNFSAPRHKSPLFFDHRGKLYLAVPQSSGCSLWEYRDGSLEWTFINLFPNKGFYSLDMDRTYVESVTFDYAGVAGDFLYFGILSFDGETSLCRRMKYNLITRALERMSLDEHERIVFRDRLSRRNFYFKPA